MEPLPWWVDREGLGHLVTRFHRASPSGPRGPWGFSSGLWDQASSARKPSSQATTLLRFSMLTRPLSNPTGWVQTPVVGALSGCTPPSA